MRPRPIRDGERGVALVMALLVLLGLSLLAIVLMMTVTTERKLAGTSVRVQQAVSLAEAGINEALGQLSSANITLANSRSVGQIFLTSPGSVPVLGTDSTAYPTRQPAGQWLQYSRPAKGPDVLTIEYKTDATKSVIYKYDQSVNPAIQTISGMPIYKVTSTGRVGSAKAKVIAEVTQKPIIANIYGAFATGVPTTFSGNAGVCGYNHRADTPNDGTTHNRDNPVVSGNGDGCDEYETGSGNLAGAWSTNTIATGGSSQVSGNPNTSPGNPIFYDGPWEALNMSQADFWAWVGAPLRSEPSNPTGIVYLDNNDIGQDATGDFSYPGGDGAGLLYVDGDMHVNGNFTYRGLVYVEGDFEINGTCWILGAIIVKGKTEVKIANGNFTVLYSSDAISQNIAAGGMQFVKLSWRQVD